MNPGITWTLQHYEPGTKTSDGGAVFPCRVCAVQVVDSGDALERHVAWHEAQDNKVREIHHHHHHYSGSTEGLQ